MKKNKELEALIRRIRQLHKNDTLISPRGGAGRLMGLRVYVEVEERMRDQLKKDPPFSKPRPDGAWHGV